MFGSPDRLLPMSGNAGAVHVLLSTGRGGSTGSSRLRVMLLIELRTADAVSGVACPEKRLPSQRAISSPTLRCRR